MNLSKHLLIICLLFFDNVILSKDKYLKKIEFSKEEINYLNNVNEDVVYIDQATKQIVNKLYKKEMIKNPGNSLLQFCQACQDNWKIVPMRVAQEASKELEILIEKNKDKFTEERYKKLNSTVKNYQVNLQSKDAQFFFASNEASAVSATRTFNNLVVNDTLQVNNLFRVNHNGTLGVRAGNDPDFASGRVVSHLPVRINFTPTQGTPNSFVVIGTTVLDSLVVRTNQTVRGSLNVHENITIKDAPVILNADNVGDGVGVFRDKSGNILNFKSLVAGNNVTLDNSNPNQITISATSSGNVSGPASATDNAVAKYDGTTGKLIQNSGVIIDDSNNLSTPGQITAIQFNGPLNGNATSATSSLSAKNFTDPLGGDVTGTQTTTVVNSIGGGAVSSAQIQATVSTVNAATNLDSPNTLVRRTVNGDFNAHTINLDGNLNLNINPSTTTTGLITKAGNRFIHNYPNSTNFFGGINAGSFSSTSGGNTGLGNQALSSLTVGANNTAVGNNSLAFNTIGFENTGVGNGALNILGIGGQNTAVGSAALEIATSANGNVAVGRQSLTSLTSGSTNTAIGIQSLSNLQTGTENIALGAQAGINLTGSETQNVYIANQGTTGESNTIRIGTPVNQFRCFISGIRGVATGVADAVPVLVDSNGQLGTISSSARYKKDIKSIEGQSDKLVRLNPVSFKYKTDKQGKLQYGLIAEEVEKVLPELVIYKDGKPDTVQYQFLPILLLSELKKLKQKVDQQELEIKQLKNNK